MYAVIPEHTKNMPTPIGEFQPNRFFIVSKSTFLSASFNYMTGIIKQYWVSFKIEKHQLLFVKCVGNFLQCSIYYAPLQYMSLPISQRL
jgi:hypothetical protein